MCSVLGGPLSPGVFKKALLCCWERLREKCVGSCTNGSAGVDCDINIGNDIIIIETRMC